MSLDSNLIFTDPYSIQTHLIDHHHHGSHIGFVPTMGNLHQGHLSLVETCAKHNDICVVSLFVNPLQFGPNEDFDSYPRSIKEDLHHLSAFPNLLIFNPKTTDIYPQGPATHVHVPGLSERYCGQSRPQFFDGIANVIVRLFNIIRPNRAYFGEKDFQQLQLIRQLVDDLFLPIDIIGCPTVRERSGLAMSSRNQYLSAEEAQQAPTIYRALQTLNTLFSQTQDSTTLLHCFHNYIQEHSDINIDYASIVSPKDLLPVHTAQADDRVLVAGTLGKTRLIDNIALSLR